MIVVHISPNTTFNDNFGYQENLLPKYQHLLGHTVYLITTDLMFDNGKVVKYTGPLNYSLSGFNVIRISKKVYHPHFLTKLFSYLPLEHILEDLKPDLVFYHGLVSRTIFDVIKYKKKHPECKIVQDNHLDWEIGTSQKGIRKVILRTYYRLLNKRSIRYVEKVYGVTPLRQKYAINFFRIPASKTDVLLMGADDEYVVTKKKQEIRSLFRKKYKIAETDFLISTGGKIDKNKNIIPLINACKSIDNVRLLIFGSISPEMESIKSMIDQNKIIYIGWIDSKDTYKVFASSDLIAFPGRHSVLWEQACASKVPCIFSKWVGMEHVNNNGSCTFFSGSDVESLCKDIRSLLFTEKYTCILNKCSSDLTDIYLYSKIAVKSLEVLKK